MYFSDFEGNEKLKDRVSAVLRQGKFPHAVLLLGEKGLGKTAFSKLTAQALVCENGNGCGICGHCRKALQGIHPDIITISVPEGKKEITVSQARQARNEALIRPNETDKKVFIIEDADKMNLKAQNALLKILEEPPAYAVFLLNTENPNGILPTVRSRCAEFLLHPVDEASAAKVLQRMFPENDDVFTAAKKCRGNIGKGIDIISEGERRVPEAENFCRALASKEEYAVFTAARSLEKVPRENLILFFDAAAELFREALRVEVTGSMQVPEAAKLIKEKLSAKQLTRLIEVMEEMRSYCKVNIGTGHLAGLLAVTCWEEIN